MPGEQQQEQHRHHLVAADFSAFLFDAHKLGDETIAAIFSYRFHVPFQITLHRKNGREKLGEQAQEAEGW